MTGRTFGLWAAVVGWHDGDTFYGVIDQGFGMFRGASMVVVPGQPFVQLLPTRIRAALIDSPELREGPPGVAATAAAMRLAPPGIYEATSYTPDEYGRPIVDLVLPGGRLFSAAMLEEGFAAPYRR